MTKNNTKYLAVFLATTAVALNTGCDSSSKTTTYWQDVAPIMYEYCGTCHVDGGAAPFALTDYENTTHFAGPAQEAMNKRSMPPWLVTSDGTCGEFTHSRWLPAEKRAVFNKWVEAGMPEGTVRADLKVATLPTLADATSYMTPKFTPEVTGGVLAENDEYRCFLIDPNITKDQFITGYDVLPSNAPLVHHVLAFSIDPLANARNGMTNAEQIAALAALSPDRDGWECFGAAGEAVSVKGIPVSWAPGQGAVNYPEDIGIKVTKGDAFVIQVHYNLEDSNLIGQDDQTEVKIHFEDSVQREGFFVLPDSFLESLGTGVPDTLEPGLENAQLSWEKTTAQFTRGFPSEKFDVYGAFPHMHERGTKMSVALVHEDGTEECLADVQNWDFEWQLYYFYKQPFELSAGDKIRTTCTYDTTDDTSPVLPGWGTQNEMCLFGSFLVPK